MYDQESYDSLETLCAPLRFRRDDTQSAQGPPTNRWLIVSKAILLGIPLASPSTQDVQAHIEDHLNTSVIQPINSLTAAVEEGHSPQTALWLLTVYILPRIDWNACAWGLHTPNTL